MMAICIAARHLASPKSLSRPLRPDSSHAPGAISSGIQWWSNEEGGGTHSYKFGMAIDVPAPEATADGSLDLSQLSWGHVVTYLKEDDVVTNILSVGPSEKISWATKSDFLSGMIPAMSNYGSSLISVE
jgi:hypothetical protein